MSRYWNHFYDYHLCAIPEARSTTGSGRTRAGEPADRLLNEPVPLQPPAGGGKRSGQPEGPYKGRPEARLREKSMR